jgi:anthranilate synthase/aminodeoxychorismate synthase-like glutamine amidotransferase
MQNILIIDNYDSFTYNIVQIIKEHSKIRYTVIRNDEAETDNIKIFDKILFSPGPGVPSKDSIMKKIISEWGDSKSILGICLGHQVIAESFGASLINLPQVYHGINEKIRLLDYEDYLFDEVPDNFIAGLYHSWAINPQKFPECLKVTTESENKIIMGIAHRQYDIRGVQFHPESYMTAYGRKILENWIVH